jgi:ubiquitin-conjugating enzyme E2 M
MTTTLNKVVLKEFKETNFKSFSDGQLTIRFPNEADLTQAEVVVTPTGGHYEGGTFVFEVKLPQNYPHSVATVTCKTKIFHPNVNYSGYICFNILTDEWNPNVRLVDYAHSLLWLLYQPNLDSRLNGDCPTNTVEFHRLVRLSLQGKPVAGTTFPQMIPLDPLPVAREIVSLSIRQRISLFNAPRAPPPPPLGFRMRIPTTTTTAVTTPTVPPPQPLPPVVQAVVVDTPMPPEQPAVAVQVRTVTTTATAPRPAPPRVMAVDTRNASLRFVPVTVQPTVVTQATVRRWPPVSGGVRFINGARAY